MPARAQLIDVFEHDDAGLHRNAEQRQEADAGRNAEIGWVTSSAIKPANGRHTTLTRISTAHLNDRNIEYRIMKIRKMVSGTMIASRFCALFAFVFALPVQVYPRGSLICAVHLLRCASSTAPPRSRPRTLYLMAT